MARIYLDTNLWNISCDQEIQPHDLLKRLDQEGAALVLGQNAMDELSATFSRPESHQRAMKLFSHLEEYTRAGLRCMAKDVIECVAAEMWALKGADNSSKFLENQDVVKIQDLISQLSRGEIQQDFVEQLRSKKSLASADRDEIRASLIANPELKQELLSIDESTFPDWLGKQTKSDHAVRLLVEKLGRRFPEVRTIELFEYAKALIGNGSRLAIGILRADFYYSWRCARRGSNPKDLLDDLYHILNATYCDVYATEEKAHSQYAGIILHSTRTAIYDRNVQPLDQWLVSVAKRERH